MIYPEYCCAILIPAQKNSYPKKETHFLLQLRPDWSRHAPNKLVCFGGKREENELPEMCIRRELQEELNWTPTALTLAVQLWVGECLKAWFYVGELDVNVADLRTEPGFEAQLIRADLMDAHPLSTWHRAVLDAYLQHDEVVKL